MTQFSSTNKDLNRQAIPRAADVSGADTGRTPDGPAPEEAKASASPRAGTGSDNVMETSRDVQAEMRGLAKPGAKQSDVALALGNDPKADPADPAVKLRAKAIGESVATTKPQIAIATTEGDTARPGDKNVLSKDTLGAYDPKSNTILISDKVAAEGGDKLKAVLREEYGEALAHQVQQKTGEKLEGDLGHRVRNVLEGKRPAEAIAEGKSDTSVDAKAVVNGRETDVKAWRPPSPIEPGGSAHTAKVLQAAAGAIGAAAKDVARFVTDAGKDVFALKDDAWNALTDGSAAKVQFAGKVITGVKRGGEFVADQAGAGELFRGITGGAAQSVLNKAVHNGASAIINEVTSMGGVGGALGGVAKAMQEIGAYVKIGDIAANAGDAGQFMKAVITNARLGKHPKVTVDSAAVTKEFAGSVTAKAGVQGEAGMWKFKGGVELTAVKSGPGFSVLAQGAAEVGYGLGSHGMPFGANAGLKGQVKVGPEFSYNLNTGEAVLGKWRLGFGGAVEAAVSAKAGGAATRKFSAELGINVQVDPAHLVQNGVNNLPYTASIGAAVKNGYGVKLGAGAVTGYVDFERASHWTAAKATGTLSFRT